MIVHKQAAAGLTIRADLLREKAAQYRALGKLPEALHYEVEAKVAEKQAAMVQDWLKSHSPAELTRINYI